MDSIFDLGGLSMEKYHYLQTLTKKFLHGDLTKLKMEYENEVNTVVDVIYEDDNKYIFDYRIEVNNESKDIKFLTHFCEYARDQIQLKRDKLFENAVCTCLFERN